MTTIRRVGLVGFGAVAESAHLPALRSVGVEVAAICDPAAARREAASQHAPQARVYNQLDGLLDAEKSLDALIVCSPPKYHADAVLAGIRAGLHVLCEKPLTLDAETFQTIRSESVARNVCIYSINNWAFSPHWSRLLKIAASGRLGALRHAEIRVLRTKPSVSARGATTDPSDWRKDPAVSGGGILVDHGWHNLYLMRRLLGPKLKPTETVLHSAEAVDETAIMLLKAPGTSGTIHLSWRARERSNAAFVAGEQGAAELRDDRIIVKADGLDETIRFPYKLSAGSAHPDWLATMWPAFEAECFGRGRGENSAEAEFCLQSIRAAYDHAIVKNPAHA